MSYLGVCSHVLKKASRESGLEIICSGSHFPRKNTDAADHADVTIDNWVVRAKELYIELTLIASEYFRAIVYDGFIREGHNVTKHWSEFWLVLREMFRKRIITSVHLTGLLGILSGKGRINGLFLH